MVVRIILVRKICEIPNFRTLFYTLLIMDWFEIGADIIDLLAADIENAAVFSFIARTSRHSTAQRKTYNMEVPGVMVPNDSNTDGKHMSHRKWIPLNF